MPWRRLLPSGEINKHLFLLIFLFFVLWLPATVLAQAAKVVDVRGTSLVERAGAAPRILGAGEPLDARDTISVARDSWAILEFSDQTRVTLRPNTVFRLDSYKADAPEAMLMGLVRGGLRVVTGFFGKRNPQGVRVQTAVATIGIRGTEFDARLCEADCAQEERLHPAPLRPQTVARVVEMKGVVAAAGIDGAGRVLVPGAALYEGDGIAAGPGGYAVLVFRDGSRISVTADSQLTIRTFRFDETRGTGYAVFDHLGGGAAVQTGAIAKQGPRFYRFISPIGEIRPRGTGFFSQVKSTAESTGDSARDAAQEADRRAAEEAAKAADEAARRAAAARAEAEKVAAEAAAEAARLAAEAERLAAEAAAAARQFVEDTNIAIKEPTPGSGLRAPSPASAVDAAAAAASEAARAAAAAEEAARAAAAAAAAEAERLAAAAAAAAERLARLAAEEARRQQEAAALEKRRAQQAAHAAQQRAEQEAARAAEQARIAAEEADRLAAEAKVNAEQGAQDVATFVSRESQSMPRTSTGGSMPAHTASEQQMFVTYVAVVPETPPIVKDAVADAMEAVTTAANEASDLAAEEARRQQEAAALEKRRAQQAAHAAQQRAEQEAARAAEQAGIAAAEVADRLAAEAKLKAEQGGAVAAAEAEKLSGYDFTQHGYIPALPPPAGPGRIPVPYPILPSKSGVEGLVAEVRRQAEALGANAVAAGEAAQSGVQQAGDLAVSELMRQLQAALQSLNDLPSDPVSANQIRERAQAEIARIGDSLAAIRDSGIPLSQSTITLIVFGLVVVASVFLLGPLGIFPGVVLGVIVAEAINNPDAVRNAMPPDIEATLARGGQDALQGATALLNNIAQTLVAQGKMAAEDGTRLANALGQGVATAKAEADRLNAEAKATADRKLSESKRAATPIAEAAAALARGAADQVRREVETAIAQEVQTARDNQRADARSRQRLLDGIRSEVDQTTGAVREGPGELGAKIGGDIGGEVAWYVGNLVGGTVAAVEAHAEAARRLARGDVAGAREVSEDDRGQIARGDQIANQWEASGRDAGAAAGRAVGDALDPRKGSQQNSAQSEADALQPVWTLVWDGEVEVAGTTVKAGTILTRHLGSEDVLRAATTVFKQVPRPDQVKVDPDLFRETSKPVEEGLYVWVRDGAVQVTKDDQTVDVSAGNAAVATKDRVRLLDAVPNFMRFDPTPLPNLSLTAKLDAFRLPDGALQNMCVIR
jgi:hypothetical protein